MFHSSEINSCVGFFRVLLTFLKLLTINFNLSFICYFAKSYTLKHYCTKKRMAHPDAKMYFKMKANSADP